MPDVQRHCIQNRHGLNISVLVERPDQPRGQMFLMHGFKSAHDRPHIETLAKAALAQNITVIRFDATHSFGGSHGDLSQATFTSYVEDLSDVIALAETQDWHQSPFIITGHSMGGIAGLEYAAAHPEKVKSIAPIATCVSGALSWDAYRAINEQDFNNWRETGWKIFTSTADGQTGNVPFSHMEDRLRYDALGYAQHLSMPLFIYVGDKDTTCPPAHQQMLFDAWGGDQKEMHVIPDAPHTYKTEDELMMLETHFSRWVERVCP